MGNHSTVAQGKTKALRDLTIIALLAIATFGLSVHFDAFDQFVDLVSRIRPIDGRGFG